MYTRGDTRSYLDTLVSVRHHRNEECNQHHYRHQQVAAEHELEEVLRPRGPQRGDVVQVRQGGLAENGEEQSLERLDRRQCR